MNLKYGGYLVFVHIHYNGIDNCVSFVVTVGFVLLGSQPNLT